MIDVVIPLYNKENKIARCLESVINQSYKPSKLIIIDDGSTDDSRQKAENVLKKYSGEYQIITKKNEGVSSARNLGFKLASSSYVAFLDADDFWDPSYLEKSFNAINEHPDIKVLSCFHRVVKGGRLCDVRQGVSEYFSGFLRNYPLAAKRGSPVNSSKVIVKRDLLERIGGFPKDAGLTEDLYVWMRLSKEANIFIVNDFLVTVDKSDDASRPSRLNMNPYILVYFLEGSRFKSLNRCDIGYLRYVYLVQSLYAIRYGTSEDSSRRIEVGKYNFPFSAASLYAIKFFAFALR